MPGHFDDYDEWRYVQHTKEAIRARAVLVFYTALVSLPFIVLVAAGTSISGLLPHEVIGVCCYHAMLTAIFIFDTLRNAAQVCFEGAQEQRLVMYRDGIPVIDATYRYRRLAKLAFAIGGREPIEE